MSYGWLTNCVVTGPDEDIERFKKAFFYMNPQDENNGLVFERIKAAGEAAGLIQNKEWNFLFLRSTYKRDEHGRHLLYLHTKWNPSTSVFKVIVEMFPTLSFVDFRMQNDGCDDFYKGKISASGVELVEDQEALENMERWYRERQEAKRAP